MSQTNLIMRIDNQAAPAAPTKENFFKSRSYRDLKQLTAQNGTLDPAADKAAFDRVIKERGYDFFSAICIEMWRKAFPLDQGELIKMALAKTEILTRSIALPADRDHTKN